MSTPPESSGLSDREVLHKFGYAQQLLRDMGGFSNFAISFSIISILTGAVTLYGHGLNNGGPAVMGIGWPLVTFFVLLISASLAELASAIPTSGALYHWSSLLGGPGWGWLTAWLNLAGLTAAIAGIDYGCAMFMTPLLGLDGAETSNVMAVFALLLLSHAALNHAGVRWVARLNDFSAIYHVAGALIVVGALLFFAEERQPLSFAFTKTFQADGNVPYAFAFMIGLLQAQWTYTGYDASAHTIEETKDARVRAPWGIYLSVAISGLFGYLMLIFVTLAIRDLEATAAASNPFIHIFETALGPRFGHAVLWIVTIAMWFCGLSCVTSTSRMIFAFARDRGVPASDSFARVSPRFRVPVLAVWTAAAAAFLLVFGIWGLSFIPAAGVDFGKAYAAVTGVSTVGLYLSYGIPIALKLNARRRGVWTAKASGPWSLGGWSGAVNAISLIWIAFISVLFVIPPNHLSGGVLGSLLAVLAVYYLAAVRGRFKGPVPQAASREELLRMEQAFERSAESSAR